MIAGGEVGDNFTSWALRTRALHGTSGGTSWLGLNVNDGGTLSDSRVFARDLEAGCSPKARLLVEGAETVQLGKLLPFDVLGRKHDCDVSPFVVHDNVLVQ